ncbi:hypothetical protein HDV62DRAFT_349273 [Trichoderma sp. SZMC 28011]
MLLVESLSTKRAKLNSMRNAVPPLSIHRITIKPLNPPIFWAFFLISSIPSLCCFVSVRARSFPCNMEGHRPLMIRGKARWDLDLTTENGQYLAILNFLPAATSNTNKTVPGASSAGFRWLPASFVGRILRWHCGSPG